MYIFFSFPSTRVGTHVDGLAESKYSGGQQTDMQMCDSVMIILMSSPQLHIDKFVKRHSLFPGHYRHLQYKRNNVTRDKENRKKKRFNIQVYCNERNILDI